MSPSSVPSPPTSGWLRFELGRLSTLAAPLVTAQVAAMSMWIVDVAMLGRVGVEDLDAASLGRLWLFATSIFVLGLLLGIDPIASQAHGARDREALVLVARRGLVTVVVLAPLWISLMLATGPGLRLLGQDPELAALAHRYVLAQLPGLGFFFGYIVLRHWLQAQGIMRPVMWTTISANGVNAFANWVLIFGNLGAPALGAVGAGYATAISFVYVFACLAWSARTVLGGRGAETPLWRRWGREAFAPRPIGRILLLGLPVGIQISLEYWAFSLTTLWAGWLGEVPLAAHSVAVAIASLTFMVPMGISFATVTRVGNLIGAGDPEGAQRAGWAAMALAGAAMVATAVVLFAGRWVLPGLFTGEREVVVLCAAILPIAALFQVADGIQIIGGGILRGMGRTLPAAAFHLVGFYLLALPLAWWLAFRAGAGVPGLWWGLTLGLTAVAGMLIAWLRRRGPASLA